MNTDVKPLTAFIVIFISVLLFGTYYWLSEKQSLLPAPSVLSLTPKGDLAVVLGNQLLIKRSEIQDEFYDLGEMGVDSPLIGDLAWLSDQEVLVRTGATEISLLQRVSFGPISEQPGIRLMNTDKKIQRCNLQTKICVPLSSTLGEMNFPYAAAVSKSGLVALAETSSHQVSLYDLQGNQLSVLSDGLYFPNRVRWNDEQLIVANTNENKIQRVTVRDNKLVGLEIVKSTKGLEGSEGEKRPIDFVKNSDGWAALIKTSDFSEGRIYQFDEDWQEQGSLELPSSGMIMSVLQWGDKIVAADTETREVYVHNGQDWGYVAWPALQNQLASNRDKAAVYEDLLILLYCVMAILFCLGCTIGFKQALDSLPTIPAASAAELSISETDPRISWISADATVKKQLKTMAFLLLGMLLMLVYFSTQMGDDVFAISGLLIPLTLLAALMAHWFYSLSRKRIGVIGNELLLLSAKPGHVVAAKPERVMYTSMALFVGDTCIMLGNQKMPYFSHKELVDNVYPLLKEKGFELTANQQQILSIKYANKSYMLMLIVIIIMILIATLEIG